MFAGSLQGVTQTVTLAIYDELAVDFNVALAIGALLVVISAVVLLSLKLILLWRSSDSTSTVPLRHFALDVALEVGEGETVALVGPVRRGQDDGAAGDRGRGAAALRAGSRSATTALRLRAARRPAARSRAAWGTCSRSTPSSRT